MSISMDHDCTRHIPIWISAKDLLKLLKKRKTAPKPTFYKSFGKTAMEAVVLVCLVFTIAALVSYCCVPNAQVHKSEDQTRFPIERQTSIGLTEMLQVMEYVSKDISQSPTTLAERLQVLEVLSRHVRLSLTESAHNMATKGSGTSAASSSPNHGPSLSRDTHDSAPPASWSVTQKKPDGAPKAHYTGRSFPLLNKLCKAIRRSRPNRLRGSNDILSAGLAILLSMTALILLLNNKPPVTTGSSTDQQFSRGSAERLELSELRQADVPSSQIEVAHFMATHERGTNSTDSPNPGPSHSPDNHDSPLDEWQVWEVIEREEA